MLKTMDSFLTVLLNSRSRECKCQADSKENYQKATLIATTAFEGPRADDTGNIAYQKAGLKSN
jgi:hypothetical protein